MPPGLTAFSRSLGALAIVLAFVSVLLTASAQQEVLKRLSAVDPGLDYSSAYVIKLQVDQAEQDARSAMASEQTANQNADKARVALTAASADLDAAWQSFAPLVRAVARSGKCDVPIKAASAVTLDERGQTLSAIQDCLGEPALSPALAEQVDAAIKDSDGVLAHLNQVRSANGKLASADTRLAQAQQQAKTLTELDAKSRKIRDSFDATSKLRSSWFLGGDLLVDFPPTLLQIVLSFISGTFGALLLTLVLIVYPNTPFNMTIQGGYGARTLLGGLIALCVYVVLNGGSAVLGTTASVGGGGNNYMAFCAIGILAGMFSDRVAAWLSARANAFFEAGGGTGNNGSGGTPATAPAAPPPAGGNPGGNSAP